MRKNPHVRICGGLGSATTLVYPTACRCQCLGPSSQVPSIVALDAFAVWTARIGPTI